MAVDLATPVPLCWLSSFFLPQELWLSLVICYMVWHAREKRHMIFDYNVNTEINAVCIINGKVYL